MATTTFLAGEALGPKGRSMRAALFERVLTRINRYFHRLVWDSDAAEDCVQETLLLLERSLQEGTYDPSLSFNRWMWIKAHSVFGMYCRKRAKLPASIPEVIKPSASRQAEVDARLDAATVLGHLRGVLEEDVFEMFVLFYGEGQTVTEIAAVTGRDRKTVRKRLQSAKRQALELL